MVADWDSTTSYSNGDVVIYNRLKYQRSQYPDTPTAGDPPDTEMSEDPNGDEIRSWILLVPSFNPRGWAFNVTYFRLIAPTYNTTDIDPDFNYSGAINFQENAYSAGGGYVDNIGYSVEWDQETDEAPACPADKCGIAFQQYQEDGEVLAQTEAHALDPDLPKDYTGWVFFNHPLYFRRTITVLVRIGVTTTPEEGPPVYSFINTDYVVTPTDNNYVTRFPSGSMIEAEYGVFNFTVPPDTETVEYYFSMILIKNASSNF
jgi:hypothetical protein